MSAINATNQSRSMRHVNPISSSVRKRMGIRLWGSIGLLSVLWGGSFFFVEIAVTQLPPFSIVCCRVGLASLVLLGYVQLTGRTMPRTMSVWGSFLIMGVLNNLIPFSLIVWGQRHIDSGLASILNATTPIFSVVLAHVLTRDERLTTNRMTGVLVGWIGVAILIGFEALNGVGLHLASQIAVLGAACAYACAAIYGRRFSAFDPVVVATGMLCGSALMMTPIALIIDQPWQLSPDTVTLAALFGLAILSTSLAYIIYFRVLASAGATNLLLVTFLIPVSAIGLGVVVLGEQIGWSAFVGMILIFAGLVVIDGRVLGWMRRKAGSDPGSGKVIHSSRARGIGRADRSSVLDIPDESACL